jgi:DNA-binding Lrp family transcriptional regulator
MALDATDKRILSALQDNSQLTAADLGQMLTLSASQAGRRRQRLETDGYITGYTARLSPAKTGLTVQGFVQVQMASHTETAARSFVRMVTLRPEIINAWTLTGDADYLLHIYCADLPAMNIFIQEVLLPHSAVARVESRIVMNALKAGAPLPL